MKRVSLCTLDVDILLVTLKQSLTYVMLAKDIIRMGLQADN